MIRPGSVWAMLAAVWAFVLLGGAPLPVRAELCSSHPAQQHDAGCILCCSCMDAGAPQAISVRPVAAPLPRGGALAGIAAAQAAEAVEPRGVPARARGPPGVA